MGFPDNNEKALEQPTLRVRCLWRAREGKGHIVTQGPAIFARQEMLAALVT